MKIFYTSILLLLFTFSAYSYTDESHYSKTFEATRSFRVFTPLNYDANNTEKNYAVIYYFHGCGGSYRKSGTYSYKDFELIPPKADNRPADPDYELPNNADFENEATRIDVIIIAVDGKIPGIPGCGVYFPSQVNDWSRNRYNFSIYIRELIDVVDARYNTMVGAQYRAITGLSMGGQAATWVAATNPHLFSSASEFCYSPAYYDVGELSYLTTIDIQQLWRNFRGLPMRHSTNTKDWLKYYTTQLYQTYLGAGFENEFYLADYCKHHAARIDLQFDFHNNHFSKPKQTVDCFSFINLYPDFEVWGYEVSSKKKESGWIYLHGVAKNGLGIYTRERLPWGKSLTNFDISVTTPAVYQPNKKYTLSRYSYKKGTITTEPIVANGEGKMVVNSIGGVGEEIGILGEGLQPPVMVLTDTINENLYLYENVRKSFAFDIVNLSTTAQTIDFMVSTENKDLLTIIKQPKRMVVPALSKLTMDFFCTFEGKYLPDYKNTGFIKISATIDGVVQDREHFVKVVVKKADLVPENLQIKVFDGKAEELAVYQYQWNQWNNPFFSEKIAEGKGNGNGKAELGEVFSLWVQIPSTLESKDTTTWHPVIPLNGRDHPDVCVEAVKQLRMNTGRSILSAQVKLNRKPTKRHPVRIPIQVEFLQAEYMEDDCHRNTADMFRYAYYDMIMFEDGTIGLGKVN